MGPFNADMISLFIRYRLVRVQFPPVSEERLCMVTKPILTVVHVSLLFHQLPHEIHGRVLVKEEPK